MKTRTRLTRLLPLLALPVVLTTATTASAALQISNGFRSANIQTATGFTFQMTREGTVDHQGVTYDTDVELDCEVDTTEESLSCEGTLTLDDDSAEVRLRFNPETERTYWGIDQSASAQLRGVHDLWTDDVMDEAKGDPIIVVWEWLDGSVVIIVWYPISTGGGPLF